MKHLPLMLLLAGCATDCPVPEPAPLIMQLPPAAPSIPAPPPAVRQLTEQYQAAARTAGKRVTQPGATADYVRRVNDADMSARTALRTLNRQGRQIRADTLQQARDAVHALQAALDAEPEGQ